MFICIFLYAAFETIALLGLTATQAEPFNAGMTLAIAQGATEPKSENSRPPQALLTEIVTWLSDQYGLPANFSYPELKFVPAPKLASLYRQGLASGRMSPSGINEPTVQGPGLVDIVAFYNDKTKTIYLADTWTGASTMEVSVLVHEMVHHLQNIGELKFECSAAREKAAYVAQEAWLNRDGLDLEQEFEIDKFSMLIKTSCVF